MGDKKVVKDHLGLEFKNEREMCKYWRISYETFRYRKNHGVPLWKALTEPIKKGNKKEVRKEKIVEDHKGNKFNTIAAMCKHWGVSYDIYRNRRVNGWDIETALTGKRIVDHEGNKFVNTAEMCKHWGVSLNTYKARIKLGCSKEVALTNRARDRLHGVIEDHEGNRFGNVKQMCEYWGIGYTTYRYRINNGYSLEEALTNKK